MQEWVFTKLADHLASFGALELFTTSPHVIGKPSELASESLNRTNTEMASAKVSLL
jgi:hypothetical protein